MNQFENILNKKNHLFFIGIDKYENCEKLKNCKTDCLLLKTTLLNNYNFDSDKVIELYNQDATKDNIIETLEHYARTLTNSDNLLIYYSGHGRLNKLNISSTESYWVTVESFPAKSSQQISHSELWNLLKAIDTLHTFLIMDCCFSGSFFENTKGIAERVFEYQSRWGLASGRNEVVNDDRIFNTSLVKTLSENKSDYLRVSELVTKVENMVVNAQAKNTPIGQRLGNLGDKGGEFIFVSKEKKINYSLEYIDSFIKTGGNPTAEDFVYAGKHLLRVVGDIDSAIEAIKKGLNLNPKILTGYISLDYCYGSKFEFKECVLTLEEGLKYFPNEPKLLANLALAKFKIAIQNNLIEDVQLSINAFELSIHHYELRPEYEKMAILYYNTGWAYIEVDNPQKAKEHFNSALKIANSSREFSTIYCGLAICYFLENQIEDSLNKFYTCTNYDQNYEQDIGSIGLKIHLRFHTEKQKILIRKVLELFKKKR